MSLAKVLSIEGPKLSRYFFLCSGPTHALTSCAVVLVQHDLSPTTFFFSTLKINLRINIFFTLLVSKKVFLTSASCPINHILCEQKFSRPLSPDFLFFRQVRARLTGVKIWQIYDVTGFGKLGRFFIPNRSLIFKQPSLFSSTAQHFTEAGN